MSSLAENRFSRNGTEPSANGTTTPQYDPVPEELTRFVRALFRPNDKILNRFIETWTEDGKKRSRIVHQKEQYLDRELLKRPKVWADTLQIARDEQANIFFGVCPRFSAGVWLQGDEGRYVRGTFNLAWQIRTIRVLWVDIDHCAPEEAVRRCEAVGLPHPSAIIGSGNGVHLYWGLTEPYLIDDVGDPPPAYKQFAEGEGKKKKVLSFIEVNGKRIYQLLEDGKTRNPEWPKLSPKGERIQEIIAGIAAKIGGDHTQDLARLLRLPCTLNRKDARNGREPVPCVLVECDPDRRYPLSDFERFADEAPAKVRAKEVAKVRLRQRVKLTAGRRNTFNDLANQCAVADDRSKADFNLCCFAIRTGLDKEEVWNEVQSVGKFGQRGRDYYELTWGNAEGVVREEVYTRACRKVGVKSNVPRNTPPPTPPNGKAEEPRGAGDWSDAASDEIDSEEPAIGPLAGVNEADNDPHRLARIWLRQEAAHAEGHLLRFYRQEFWRWQGARWRALPDAEIRGTLARFCKRQLDQDNKNKLATWSGEGDAPLVCKVTRELVGNVTQALSGDVLLSGEENQPFWIDAAKPPYPAHEMVAFRNGLLHLPTLVAGDACETPCVTPITPAYFSPNVMDYDFDAEAPEPAEWLAFLENLWPADQEAIDTLQEWFGYCLLPDTSQQKILLVVGPRRSGKGTIARVLRAIVGIKNTAGPTLASLGTNFGLWPLLGKTLAVISDARLSGRTDVAVVAERLLSVSGEDAQTIDRKNLSLVTTNLSVRFVILTNELPKLNDPSGALVGRMVILRQTKSWFGKEDTTLTARLLRELPSIFLWAVDGWKRLCARGRFQQPESGVKMARDMEDLASPIGAFLRERCVLGLECEIFTDDLFAEWKKWCEAKGHKPGSNGTFGRDLRASLPMLEVRQPRYEGGRVRVYVGLRLRRPEDESTED